MSSITLTTRGKFKKTKNFLNSAAHVEKWIQKQLDIYGQKGVERLREFTPVDSGATRDGWYYETWISSDADSAVLSWWNTNVNEGVPIALVIEYGHITGWGGYVPPYPYIDEALVPIISEMVDKIWEGVRSA